jgi:hypothetical protein
MNSKSSLSAGKAIPHLKWHTKANFRTELIFADSFIPPANLRSTNSLASTGHFASWLNVGLRLENEHKMTKNSGKASRSPWTGL